MLKESSIFKEVTLTWKGKDYIIPSSKVMGAIACVEQYVTLHELHQTAQGGNIKLSTLSAAYAAVLQYAGAGAIDPEVVYHAMFVEGTGRDVILSAIEGLIIMMVPPSAYEEKENGERGNLNRQARRAAASLSKKRIKRR